MFDQAEFQSAIEGFEFQHAERLLEDAPPEVGAEMALLLESTRKAALDSAHALRSRIVDLGQGERYLALMEIAADPATVHLLDLLPGPARQRSDIYLRETAHWVGKQRSANRRRLTDAREALDALDVELAKAILGRIDSQFFDNAGSDERDRLILEMESRAMELDELSGTAEQVIAAEKPARRRRWNRGR